MESHWGRNMTSASRLHVYIYTYMNTFTYAYVYMNTYIHACLYTVYTHTLWRKFLSSVLWDLGLLIIKWQKWKINYQVFINMWKLSRILFHKFTFNRKRKVIYLQIVLHVVNWAKLCCSFLVCFSPVTGELLFKRECLIVLPWLFSSWNYQPA